MKICITSQGADLESQVDPRFGRCQYFALYDTETLKTEFIPNENKDGMGGVGIQSATFMSDKGVKAVLTGNVGPNAYDTLKAGGIEVISGVSGKILPAIDKYKRGEYKTADNASVDSHFGTK